MSRHARDDPPNPTHRVRKLPRDLGLRFKAKVKSDGVLESYYIYGWLWRATIQAKQGRGHLLPPAVAERGTVGPTIQVRWTQGEDQYQEFIHWIEDVAGSSLTAVIRAAAVQFVEVGSLLDMPWPDAVLGEWPLDQSE